MPEPADNFAALWAAALEQFDSVLADLGADTGELWDPETLAVFLDVPSLAIADLIPRRRALGIEDGFDLVGKVRTDVKRAMARLRRARVAGAAGPLPLEFGLTEALLAWEWIAMEAAGEKPFTFFERLRQLRLRMPEVALCERTVHRFCERVPPPRIAAEPASRPR